MNKIYKSIWNRVTRTFTAVSEIQQVEGKKAKSVLIAAALCILTTGAVAAEDTEVEGVVIGDNQSAMYRDLIGVYLDYGLNFKFDSSGEANIYLTSSSLKDSNGSLLLAQSGGSEQVLLNARNLFWGNGANAFNSGIEGSATSVYKQNIIQKDEIVTSKASYVLGEGAYDIVMANLEKLGAKAVYREDGIVDILYDGKQYSTTGIHVDGGGYWGGTGYFSTLSLLVAMEVENGKSLTITAGEGQTSNWYTKVHGDESTSLYYVGSDSDSTVLNIDSLVTAGTAFKGNSLFTTDFKGKVYFQNITANLKAADALGNASLLKAEDSDLNLYNDISVGSLEVVGSRIEFVDSAAKEIKVSDDASIDKNSKIAGDSKVISVGGDLFVGSDNLEFTNSAVSATNIEVKSVDAFGEGTSSIATNQYVFDGAKGIQKNAIEANSIVLKKGADITYDAHSTIKTSTTKLSNASRLEVENQSQLGSSVVFDRQTGESSRSQLVLVSSGDLSVGSSENLTFSGDGLTILRASSQSNKINISENVNFSQYSGWVRVESGNFALTEKIAQQFNANDADSKTTGLSIGENGIVSVTGDKSIALDRLGWVSVSNKDSVGILDLSDFVFSDRNTAALTVEDVSVTDGVIRVDSNEVLDGLATDQAEGSVFSLDDGKVGQLLVEIRSCRLN